jgi:hypothetical protein
MAKEDKVSAYINISYHVGDANVVSFFVFSCPFVLDSDRLSADSNVLTFETILSWFCLGVLIHFVTLFSYANLPLGCSRKCSKQLSVVHANC